MIRKRTALWLFL
ncbi:hemolysin transporter protein shlB, partial [Yersinia pestis PY-11]